ncbi:hypothetical protein AeNC1_017496, partial [Aphanomyces euteiches]
MSNIPNTMRAVGSHEPLPIDNPSSLVDLVLDVPTISGRELLVQIKAVAVNPADLAAAGPDATLFKAGDQVFYGSGPPGQDANAEYQAVDERLVALKPSSLSFGEAAGLPATTLTAYDSIFNRLEVSKKDPSVDQLDAKSALIINGAGGVGSMAIQLLKELTDVTVIATASRPKSSAWVTDLGADHAVNHNASRLHFGVHGSTAICAINPFTENLPCQDLFMKSVTFVWECMTTRFAYATEDLMVHHRILSDVGALVDSKRVRSIVGEDVGVINAANLKKAHAMVEAGHVV